MIVTTGTARTAAEIARVLGETAEQPVAQIATALDLLGEGAIRALLAEALAIEAGGGETIVSGKRRRTPGGIFLRLVRERATVAQRRAIFPPPPRAAKAVADEAAAAAAFTWEDFGALLGRPGARAGGIATVKITVIGRPGRVLANGEAVLVTFQGGPPPSLPKGLPSPVAPVEYAVLIARKQWAKVEGALRQPDDKLIIEGHPTLDPRFAGITVLATQVTTRDQQAAKRANQQAAR